MNPHRTPWLLLALSLSLTAAAIGCGDDDQDPSADPQSEDEIELTALDTCAEDDFNATPFMGPAFDEAGQFIGEAEGTFLVSATVLQLKDDAPATQQTFGQLLDPMMPELMANAGMLGVSLGSSPSCGTARTLTIWRDHAAMIAFVAGDAHAEAMGRIDEVSALFKTTTFSAEGQEVLEVDWDAQRDALREVPSIRL